MEKIPKRKYIRNKFGYETLYEIQKPAFHRMETVNSMMLLPSTNFIGGKERMKLLHNFHLTKVKQNFFLIFVGGGFLWT